MPPINEAISVSALVTRRFGSLCLAGDDRPEIHMKVAICGCASDFATALLPRLLADDSIDLVVGIDWHEPRLMHDKLEYRAQGSGGGLLADELAQFDAVFDFANAADESHVHEDQKPLAGRGGSSNLIEAASAAGCERVIELRGAQLTETAHGASAGDATRVIYLKAPIVVGPDFENPAIETLCRPRMVWPSHAGRIQLLHQDDLAKALHVALTAMIDGSFDVAPDDAIEIAELASIHGQKLRRWHGGLVKRVGRILFRSGLSSSSSDWIYRGESALSNEKFKLATGWSPRFASREAAEIMLLQQGRPILPGKLTIKSKPAAEAALGLANRLFGQMADDVPGLSNAIGGRDGFEQILGELEHEWLDWNGTSVHLELHIADPEAPTMIFTPGLGNYTRFWTAAMGAFRERGINVIGVDRPGHGISEGLRGDATVGENIEILGEVVKLARDRFSGPVFLSGASLGGITTWWALPFEFDIDGAVISNMVEPGTTVSFADKVKVAVLRLLAKVVPRAPMSVKQIANFDAVARDPNYRHYFEDEPDRIFVWTVTLRSALSIGSFEPPKDWKTLDVPALVLTGGGDEMIPAALVRKCFKNAGLPNGQLVELPGLTHGLFDEHLDETIDYVARFVVGGERQFSSPVPSVG